jgi:hypothetical protein
VCSQPLSELILRKGSGRKAFNRRDCIDWLNFDFQSVAGEEEPRNRPCYPLISIYEAMIAGQPESICGRQIRGIWIAVCEQVLRTSQG